ncbi:MAG: hypothetical protein QM786_04560 [Breznakibacter sp.]
MKKIVNLFLIQILLLGCAKEKINVNVFVSSKFLNDNAVKIDDTLTLKQNRCEEGYCKFVLKSGEHLLSINNKKTKFEIGEYGGILNVEKRDFVIFPIKYTSNDEITNASINSDFPIIIDSLIIYEKSIASNQADLIKLLKNSAAKEIFSYNIEKMDKSQLFINKNWDYEINDTISEYITVKTTAKKGIIEHKRKIVSAELFVLYAKNSNNWNVELIENKDLIELVKNFKKE